MNKILLPIIKNFDPVCLAEKILNVQPMTADINLKFALRHQSKEESDVLDAQRKEGAMMHSLMDGWMCWYGGKWIPQSDYTKIKVAGL